jgi:hypothetical protein
MGGGGGKSKEEMEEKKKMGNLKQQRSFRGVFKSNIIERQASQKRPSTFYARYQKTPK